MGSRRGSVSLAATVVVVALVGTGLAGALAVASVGPFAAPEHEPEPVPDLSRVPTESAGADRAQAAEVAARHAGQGAHDVRLGVEASDRTGGWSAWFFRTDEDRLASMLVAPDGDVASWSGCAQADAAIARCAGGVDLTTDSLALSGPAGTDVAGVDVLTRGGARLEAEVGERAWLVVAELPPPEEPSTDAPETIVAHGADGAEIARVPARPEAPAP